MIYGRHKLALTALFGTMALVDAQAALAAEPGPASLIGSELAEPCAWPATVSGSFGQGKFGLGCGAALIHPELIVVYGECVTSALTFEGATFGDNVRDGPLQEALPLTQPIEEACVVHPDQWLGFCRLAEPVDLPINPIVYGCESGIIEVGREVAMAGFGLDVAPPDGEWTYAKRWALSELQGAGDVTVLVPEDGPIGCTQLDLGTPLYVEYPDGSWHVIGVAVETADCSGTTAYRRLDSYVPWIESTFDLDVTPCHDVDGSWNPNEACAELSMVGPEGSGTWEDWCAGTPTVALSETCGPGFGADSSEPLVVIDQPAAQASFASGVELDIAISVNHPVSGVQIEINGALQGAIDASWPYGFWTVPFPDGMYTLVAFAEGEDGVTRESAPIQIAVGEQDPAGTETGAEDTGAEDTGAEDTGASDAGAGADEPPGSDSCACETDSDRPPGLGWMALVFTMFVGVRRSTRCVRRTDR